MDAYRFLGDGVRDTLAHVVWSREWTAAPAGLVAYRAEHLQHWLAPYLWRVELDGEVIEREVSMVGERGRLIAQVDAWDATACHAFIRWCVERHPSIGSNPDDVGWQAACCAGYVAAQTAGMDAVAAGGSYDAAEQAERSLQSAWVLARLGLVVGSGSSTGL